MIDTAFKKKMMIFAVFLLVLPILVKAETFALPFLNKDEFSCYFNLCSFPDFILTSATINNASYSSYSNYSQWCNATNLNISSYFTSNETDPMFNGNWSNISSWLYNQTTPAIEWVQAQNYLTGYSESDPYYFSNPNNYFNDSSILNVNSSNYSSYCQNLLSGQYCYNESYNPYITGKTCSQLFGNCTKSTTNDTCTIDCSGVEYNSPTSVNPRIEEVYINASSFFAESGQAINVTCQFKEYQGSANYEYLWYFNKTDWIRIANWSNVPSTTGSGRNQSAVFILNSSEGTHIARCIISFNDPSNYCANSGSHYDNDDVNFTVTEFDEGNITYEVCESLIQNITANNSIYLNGYESSYFYPYFNPYNFINSTYNSSYYLNSNPFGFYNSSTLPYFINNTYNATYDSKINNTYNSTYDSYYNHTYNSSYDAVLNWYYNKSNPFNFWNSTNAVIGNGNISNNAVNISQLQSGTLNILNITFNSNLNTTIYNQTSMLNAESTPVCQKYYNASPNSAIKFCDCYNSTHKWMANTC